MKINILNNEIFLPKNKINYFEKKTSNKYLKTII